jgi:hypothetical protein
VKGKIHPRYLAAVRKLVFNRESLSGGDFANRMKQNYSALHSNFNVRGIYPDDAEAAAAVLEKWASDCKSAATSLRNHAKRVRAS